MSRLSPYWLWIVLALPAFAMVNDLAISTNPRIFRILVHPSGEFSARFMIIAMMATPLTLVFKGWRGPIWLRKNRRYFGVAAGLYAFVHVVFYVIDKASLDRIISELSRLDIWTGWLAFAIFIPLTVTSMDHFVRVMGPKWKQVQRWTYPAAILTLLHWAALHKWDGIAPAAFHFGPLIVLEAYRIWYWYLRPGRRRKTNSPQTVENAA